MLDYHLREETENSCPDDVEKYRRMALSCKSLDIVYIYVLGGEPLGQTLCNKCKRLIIFF